MRFFPAFCSFILFFTAVGCRTTSGAAGLKDDTANSTNAATNNSNNSNNSASSTVVDLADFKGQTFLNFMMADQGLKAKMDANLTTPFAVASKASVHQAANNFDPTVYTKVTNQLVGGDQGLDALIDALAGQQVTPSSFPSVLANEMSTQNLVSDPNKIGLAAVMVAPFISIASGSGVSVNLDGNNRYNNYGYKPGSDDATILAKDVKSGRSFGASRNHPLLDPTDVYFLNEVDSYLSETADPTPFFQNLMQILTQCDSAGLAALSPLGQTLTTDFMAVYTAELDRNLMAKLKKYPWQNDLAEVTILTSYGNAAKLVMKQGEVVPGSAKDYFGVGAGGSGIGDTRKDRQAMQLAVTNAERTLHPEIVNTLGTLTGTAEGADVMHGLMLYLNDPANQPAIIQNASALTQAVSVFALQIRQDADQITAQLQEPAH